MANPFLNKTPRDTETAILLEQAIIHDIHDAVAFTDGNKIYINTPDNLDRILPAYNDDMLKWLLWHEKFHKELSHHHRYFKFTEQCHHLHLTKSEINIIMDILVHDSLSKMFPELIPTAQENLAQFRNRNSLKYTFKTHTLEEMLREYSDYKSSKDEDETGAGTKSEDTEDISDDKTDDTTSTSDKLDESDKSETDTDKSLTSDRDTDKKTHGEGGGHTPNKKKESKSEKEGFTEEMPDEHDETDWSKLEKIDSQEFLDEDEAYDIEQDIHRLRRKNIRLARLTETLNGLATSTRQRTYAKPNPVRVGGGVVLKGSTPGKAKLYLCFDASGSMSSEMRLFKDIISKSIPQAMNTTTVWFSGYSSSKVESECEDKTSRTHTGRYYKGTFTDFFGTDAGGGYSDDGDRTIELCWEAEQLGYTPIGITDGGGRLSWSKDKLKQLKRTILIGDSESWLKACKEVNPRIQIQWI